jgi:hypothetical protein
MSASDTRVTIKRRSEIDIDKLALALLALARSMAAEEQKRPDSVVASAADLDPKSSKKRKESP